MKAAKPIVCLVGEEFGAIRQGEDRSGRVSVWRIGPTVEDTE